MTAFVLILDTTEIYEMGFEWDEILNCYSRITADGNLELVPSYEGGNGGRMAYVFGGEDNMEE